MKKQILTILKNSGTTPAVLNNEELGVYVYENDVFVLKYGDDIEFDSLEESEQKSILSELQSGSYKLDETYQG